MKFGEKQRLGGLSDKQKKIAAVAGHPEKIDAADFAALRAGKKVKEDIKIDEKMSDVQKTAVRSVQDLRANLHKDGHLDTKPSISDTKRTIKFVKNASISNEDISINSEAVKIARTALDEIKIKLGIMPIKKDISEEVKLKHKKAVDIVNKNLISNDEKIRFKAIMEASEN